MAALQLGFFSIPVNDLAAAQTFYGNVMGWTFAAKDAHFVYIFGDGEMLGSLELTTNPFPLSAQGPLLYFRANAINKVVETVKAFEGRVIEISAIEHGARGYTAKILDPFGNRIGFWAPEK